MNRREILNSIRIKIIIIIIIPIIIAIIFSTFGAASLQIKNIIHIFENSLTTYTEILKSVLRNSMLQGEPYFAKNTLSDLKRINKFKEVEIISTEGLPAFTDEKKSEFLWDKEYFNKVLTTYTPFTNISNKKKIIEYYAPIKNEEECYKCHNSEKIRGVNLLLLGRRSRSNTDVFESPRHGVARKR